MFLFIFLKNFFSIPNLISLMDKLCITCRPMTCIEKHRLGKMIRKLPEKALDRVIQILKLSNFSANDLPERIFVDLEKEVKSNV